MNVTFSNSYTNESDSLVVLYPEEKRIPNTIKELDKACKKTLTRALKDANFKGTHGETLVCNAPFGQTVKRIIVIGTGTVKSATDQTRITLGGKLYSSLVTANATQTTIVTNDCKDSDEIAALIAYGALLKSYQFTKYKTKKNDENTALTKLTLVSENTAAARKNFKKLEAISKGVFLARDVVTEPPNELYPESYAKRIKNEFAKLNVTVSVLTEKQLAKLGMGALLGVGQGSVRESHVVAIHYQGANKKDAPIAFVGKGVTFDTGGISLKPSAGMEDMKYDMGGSASVVGVMKALAERSAKVNAVGIVGLVENMPGHNAQRPSDVVTSMSGQTIEVLNTDAEGRLVLADVLWYAQEKFKAKTVINLATLTGAIVVALGNEHAGLFSNNDTLSAQLTKAGQTTDEKLWRFPLSEAYDKLIDSKIADIQNISSGRGAGSITAAQFLQRFIQKDVAWAHLDIAGMAWNAQTRDICPEGASGFGVRLLDQFVADNFEA